MWWFADLVCDRKCFEQEFLRYELTDFLFLSSQVFLRSCSFDLRYWKQCFPSKNHKLPPWKSTHKRRGSHFELNTRIFHTNKADWDSSTCHGKSDEIGEDRTEFRELSIDFYCYGQTSCRSWRQIQKSDESEKTELDSENYPKISIVTDGLTQWIA